MQAKVRKQKLTVEHRHFLKMLPTITRVARQAFSNLDPEAKEEAVAEVIAAAFILFVGLARDGRESLAYPTVLAMYGVRRVRVGRQAATPQNVRDVSSLYCQLNKGFSLQRLDRYDRDESAWLEVVVEDRTTNPADVAAARIDIAAWFRSLPRRNRKIATTLATGETTGDVARMFKVSDGRISQLRRELRQSWMGFHGEPIVATA